MALRQRGDRQSVHDLILQSPVRVPVLRARSVICAATIYAIVWLIAALLVSIMVGRNWLGVGALALIVLPMVFGWSRFLSFVSSWREQAWLTKRWRETVELPGPVGERIRAGDVAAGTWICLEADYKQQKRERGERGMLVDAVYGFLVATIKENGNEQLMSFADGSVRRCSRRTPVYMRNGSCADFGNQHDYGTLDASGAVLDGMIRKLDLNARGLCELDELVGAFEPFYGSAAVAEALRAAEWWSFLSLGDANDLRITDAGRVWAEAEPSRLADRERVARVSERRRNEPTFSIGANYGVINVAKTIRGRQIQPVEAFDSTSSVNNSEGFFQL